MYELDRSICNEKASCSNLSCQKPVAQQICNTSKQDHGNRRSTGVVACSIGQQDEKQVADLAFVGAGPAPLDCSHEAMLWNDKFCMATIWRGQVHLSCKPP